MNPPKTFKVVAKGIDLPEVEAVLLALHDYPIIGDIVPTSWHKNFPPSGDIRHGKKGNESRKGPPRRDVQHYINMHVLAHILSWYRWAPWMGTSEAGTKPITKKFSGHMLRINRTTLADHLHCKKEQISAALTYLDKDVGAIHRLYAKIGTDDVKKAVFVLPILEKITELSTDAPSNNCLQSPPQSMRDALQAHNGRSFKRTTVTASGAPSSALEAHNGHSLKRTLSQSLPKDKNNDYDNDGPSGSGRRPPSEVISPSATGTASLDPAQKDREKKEDLFQKAMAMITSEIRNSGKYDDDSFQEFKSGKGKRWESLALLSLWVNSWELKGKSNTNSDGQIYRYGKSQEARSLKHFLQNIERIEQDVISYLRSEGESEVVFQDDNEALRLLVVSLEEQGMKNGDRIEAQFRELFQVQTPKKIRKKNPYEGKKQVTVACSVCQKPKQIWDDVIEWVCPHCRSTQAGPNTSDSNKEKSA